MFIFKIPASLASRSFSYLTVHCYSSITIMPELPQHDCPIFRLPQELRYQIYEAYLYEEEGYFHNATSEKLFLLNRQTISLDLMYTCNRIGREMKGVALYTNKVTFTTGDYERADISRAARFRVLLEGITLTRRQMLYYARKCVSPSMLNEVASNTFVLGRRQPLPLIISTETWVFNSDI
jgi:hypothetical protein